MKKSRTVEIYFPPGWYADRVFIWLWEHPAFRGYWHRIDAFWAPGQSRAWMMELRP